MIFRVSSTTLNARLQQLSKVLGTKLPMQILDCFLFEIKGQELIVKASDNENTMKSTIDLDDASEDARFCITAKTILDAVKELPEQPLTFEMDSQMNLKISYLNGSYNLMARSAEEYPQETPIKEDAISITMPSASLVSGLARTIFATDQKSTRPVMSSIYFDITPDSLFMVATDGQKLVRDQFMNVKSETPSNFILPYKPSNLLKNILSKDDSDVVIKFDDRNVLFSFANGTLSCRLVDTRYPNYQAVIPKNNPFQLTVDRKVLLSVIRRVLPFSSVSSQLVRLHIEVGNLVVSAENIEFATSAKESITCDYNGTPMDIGFNGTSLSEILSNNDSEELIISLADPSRAGVVVPSTQPENEDILMLVMPILLLTD